MSRHLRQAASPNPLSLDSNEAIDDYRIAYRSRMVSRLAHAEVMRGRTRFAITGAGKEVPQVALARVFRSGDWRAGYYRDQTFLFAAGMLTERQFFAQLYADPDIARDPASGGRSTTAHLATRILDPTGHWVDQLKTKNSSMDCSPLATQMGWMLGLAYASKLYRNESALAAVSDGFSNAGNEVVFGTIGDASTSEGLFFEAMNAAAVLQVPLVVSVWDDGYGISVPIHLQTAKASISQVMQGFRTDDVGQGIDVYVVAGWDYEALRRIYQEAAQRSRLNHVPSLVHVTELTQPMGHSSSGSHDRYKSKERLAWEHKHDCLARMREWLLEREFVTEDELEKLEKEDKDLVESDRHAAWDARRKPLAVERDEAIRLLKPLAGEENRDVDNAISRLRETEDINRRSIYESMLQGLAATVGSDTHDRKLLSTHAAAFKAESQRLYRSHLYSESSLSPMVVPESLPTYLPDAQIVDGRVVLVHCFDHHLATEPKLFIIGEDVGQLGDVNLVFEGLQEKYGQWRVTDTGIREATILGQGIGAAMRGLRPVVDIQYVDYLPVALELASDALATLHHRTAGGQKAPVIVRTKGHRLLGMWHAGSPMSMILNSCRGIYLCVPRDMTRAAGMYNTLLQADNPAIVIEVLSGYRLKERLPSNIGTFTIRLGYPDLLREGGDVTVVTYGALCRIAGEAADVLAQMGIDIEIFDIQTLNPFDTEHRIVKSLQKTNAILFLDEDVPGGATAFMMQQVLEIQEGWGYLDAPPRTLTASDCRTPYGTDGDYFTKPSQEDIVETVYGIMRERNPAAFPPLIESPSLEVSHGARPTEKRPQT